jgi:hypothetical protein
MAKLESGYLFTLISSLTKAEKRHFKVYSNKRVLGKENVYFRLFNAIEKQKDYDETVLSRHRQFKDLPTLKKRLYKALLTSLSEYHSSTGIEVRNLLNHIEILFNKSLFNHCSREIRKAKKIIEKNELYEEWLEILKWEYKIAVKRSSLRNVILDEEKKIIAIIDNQKKYRDTANLFLAKYQRFGVERSPRDLQGMKRILTSSLLKDETKALSFNAKQNFYDCHSLFSVIKGDYRDAHTYGKQAIELYRNNPEIISANSFSYLVRINNFLLACLETKRYDEMREYIDQLQKTRNELRSPAERATAFFYLYHLLNYYIYTGKFHESRDELENIELELTEHEANLNTLQKITFYAIIAQVHFGREDYKGCLLWLNKILSFGEIRMRTDLECFIRLFRLIVHYEARTDQDLMGSLLKSTYRYLRKHEHLYKFETTMMDFFRQYLLTGNRNKNMAQPFSLLKEKLELLSKDPYEKQALSYFDFISWLESKIEKRSFEEVMRRKAHPN